MEAIGECREQFYVFGCKDESTMIRLPIALIEQNLDRLVASTNDEGIKTHWHIVFFRYADGRMTWLLSNPQPEEISINEYLMPVINENDAVPAPIAGEIQPGTANLTNVAHFSNEYNSSKKKR